MKYLKILRIAWRLAPWILAAICALLLWRAPQAGSSSAPGQTVTVAGKAALTKPARKWKKRPRATCKPAPGETGGSFQVQTREPSAEELERLARQYGFLFGDRELSADLSGMPMPPAAPTPVAGGTPQLRIARMLGEYAAPTLRYGGTFAAGLLEDGELEARFDPAPPPKLGFPLMWGAGGLYDLTSDSTGADFSPTRHSRAYAFLEPIQTKQFYWRLEAGALQILDGWDPYVGLGAEWRSEPWIRKNHRGLRAVKVSH